MAARADEKLHDIQLKLQKLTDDSQSLRKDLDRLSGVGQRITEIQISLQRFHSEIEACENRLLSFEKNSDVRDNALQTAIQKNMNSAGENAKFILKIDQMVIGINKEISKLKVTLSETEGRLNQCYASVQKFQEATAPAPMPVPDQTQQDIIRRYFKRILLYVLATGILGFLGYAGRRYFQDYIHQLLPAVPATPVHQVSTEAVN